MCRTWLQVLDQCFCEYPCYCFQSKWDAAYAIEMLFHMQITTIPPPPQKVDHFKVKVKIEKLWKNLNDVTTKLIFNEREIKRGKLHLIVSGI